MKQLFSNPQHQAQIDEKGFFVTDFFTANKVQELRQFYRANNASAKKGFHSTQADMSTDYRRRVFEMFSQGAQPNIQQLIEDYVLVAASFVVKEPDIHSAVRLHQDWNLTNEPEFTAYNIWCPLTDTNAANGALHIVAGSHKLPATYRGTGLPDSSALCQGIAMDKLTCVPLKAGQAIVYDVRCLHASPPNTGSETRIACALGIVPKRASLIHYSNNAETGLVSEHSISPEFFLHYRKSQEFMSRFPVIKTMPFNELKPKQYTPREVSHLLRKENWFICIKKYAAFISN